MPHRAAPYFRNSLPFSFRIDIIFLLARALEKAEPLNGSGCATTEIVTMAKKSCTAFERPVDRKNPEGTARQKRSGRPTERTVRLMRGAIPENGD